MTKPIATTTDWAEPFHPGQESAPRVPVEQVTQPGRHEGADFVARNHEIQADRRARYLRDYGGRERDPRRVPPPEHQLSGRTSKSASRIRFPSEQFRRNYAEIDWSA
jgi:hypothetical protein